MQCAECSESNRNIVILVLILVHEGTLAQSTLLDFAAQRQLCALTYQTSPHSSGSCYSDSMSCQHWLKSASLQKSRREATDVLLHLNHLKLLLLKTDSDPSVIIFKVSEKKRMNKK